MEKRKSDYILRIITEKHITIKQLFYNRTEEDLSKHLLELHGWKEDKPENYNMLTYHFVANGDHTVLTLAQDNIKSEEEQKHALANWQRVLKKLKEVVESK